MSYAQYGLIEASDYNGLVGTNPNTTSGKLNTVWSTGGNSAGYGQTALATVAVGQTVGAAEWANLTTTTTNIASHQGTSITSVTTPAVGDTVTYVAAIPTNLTTVYTNRLNAASQGSAGTNSAALGTSFDSNALFTLTASFANGDAARYFFNAGGQISFNCSPPANVSAPDAIFNDLASNVGTVFISAPNSGTANIAGNTFSGITKLGGGGLSAPTISTNSGYYGLSTSNTTVFTQISGDGGPYTNSSINFIAKTNGVQGSNSDNGNVITVYSTWAISPSGTPVSGGATTIITVRYPSSTYIANTWGTVATTASVVGSNIGVTTTTTTTTAAPTTTTTTTAGPSLGFSPAISPSYWSSNQLNAEASTYAEFRFNTDGTITVDTNTSSSPLESYSNNWATGSVTGSVYEIRAYMTTVDSIGSGYYQIFGGTQDTPSQGNYTGWYNLGTQRTTRVQLDATPGSSDYEKLVMSIEIGLAGTSTALITQTFQLDIGAI